MATPSVLSQQASGQWLNGQAPMGGRVSFAKLGDRVGVFEKDRIKISKPYWSALDCDGLDTAAIDPMRASRRVFLGTGAVHNVLDRLSDGLEFTNNALSIRQEANPCVGAIQFCDCQRHAAEVSAKLVRPVLDNFAPKTGLNSSRSCGVPFWTPNKDRSGARHGGEPSAPVEGAVPGTSRNKQP